MATGLPVVTSTQCGVAELLSSHDAGFVRDAQDTAGIAQAMNQLMDPALRHAMGMRAREAVLPLTADAMTAQLLALYRGLVEGPL